jgi:hypothetical protein
MCVWSGARVHQLHESLEIDAVQRRTQFLVGETPFGLCDDICHPCKRQRLRVVRTGVITRVEILLQGGRLVDLLLLQLFGLLVRPCVGIGVACGAKSEGFEQQRQ